MKEEKCLRRPAAGTYLLREGPIYLEEVKFKNTEPRRKFAGSYKKSSFPLGGREGGTTQVGFEPRISCLLDRRFNRYKPCLLTYFAFIKY